MTGLQLKLGAVRRINGGRNNISQRCRGADPPPLMQHFNRRLNIVVMVAAPDLGMVMAGVVMGNTTTEYSATIINIKNVAGLAAKW
jgi:hypothetical protein